MNTIINHFYLKFHKSDLKDSNIEVKVFLITKSITNGIKAILTVSKKTKIILTK